MKANNLPEVKFDTLELPSQVQKICTDKFGIHWMFNYSLPASAETTDSPSGGSP